MRTLTTWEITKASWLGLLGHLSGLGKSQGCKVLLVLMIVKHLPLHQCVQCEPLPPRVGCGNT